MSFRITDACTGCGRCVAHCPTGAITGALALLHRVVASRCIDCGACGAACPEDDAVLDAHGEACSGAVLGACERTGHGACARVDTTRCTGCGDCVSACPFDAMRVLELGGLARRVALVMDGRCTGCALCELECTRGAIVASVWPRACEARTS